MNMNRSPFPFQDFVRAKALVRSALCQDDETWVLLTGDTGTGKTALLRELRGESSIARAFACCTSHRPGAWGPQGSSRSSARACACAPACATP